MNQPGHYPQPTATPAGQPEAAAAAQAFLADIESIMATRPGATSFRDPTPTPTIGTTPPVAQPGIPPQSRAAVDYAVRVLSTSVATALTSGSVALIMLASRWADPVVCGIVFGAPIGFAVPIAALISLAKRTKEVVEAAPPQINQYYSGPIQQDNRQQHLHNRTTGVIAYTGNQPELPPAH
ncbi:hypothetical protein ACWC09_26305 [Streptomyces sp. NPDC001617]